MKLVVFLLFEFVMKLGIVVNRFYYNIDFLRGYIGIKSFNVEVVNEVGVFIFFYDIYFYYWVVVRYYICIGFNDKGFGRNLEIYKLDFMFVRNSGFCRNFG